MLRTPLYVALLSALPLLAHAQTTDLVSSDEISEETIALEDSYVRGDYLEIDQLRNTKEIIVITKEQIQERGNRTISDALAKVPGISVGATNTGEIDLRGQGFDNAFHNIQVLVDGVPVTQLTNHPFRSNYDVLPIDQVERIEVIPGGGSVLYGAGTVGGVINVTSTMKNLDKPVKSVSAEYNSNGWRSTASVGSKIGERFTAQFSATKNDQDLFFKNTYRDGEYYSGGLRWDLTDDQALTLRVSHMDESAKYLDNVTEDHWYEDYVPKDNKYIIGDRKQTRYTATYTNDINDKLHLISDMYYSDGFFMGTKEEYKKMNERGYGMRNKLQYRYGEGSSVIVGVDYTNQQNSMTYEERSWQRTFDYEKELAAVFISNNIKWGKWESTQGVRREYAKWSVTKPQISLKQNFTDDSTRWNTAAELSLAYHYRPTGRIFARYELGYNYPDGIQITEDVPVLVNGKWKKGLAVTDADDETYDMLELGMSDYFGFTTANVTAWYSQTDNELRRGNATVILPDGSDFKLKKTLNYLNTKRWGVDVNFMQQFDRLTLEESYSYTMGKVDYNAQADGESNFIDDGIKKVPKHKVTLRATYEFNDYLATSLTYSWVGKYQQLTKEEEKEPGVSQYMGNPESDSYQLVDLTMKWTPKKWLMVNAGVTNLFDEVYAAREEETTRVPGQPRTFFVGVKATY